jgi:Protein of unknown function (DUF3307)
VIFTLSALLLAHALADFIFQTKAMVARKNNAGILILHTGIVLILSLAMMGRIDAWQIYAVAGLHLVIDAAKVHLAPPGLRSYLADQTAHLAVIGVVALLWPDLWSGGFWGAQPLAAEAPRVMLVLAGAILATRAGGFAIGMLMSRFSSGAPGLTGGLTGAGEVIGLLERGLTYTFILIGEPEAVGFLLAAKSILRFGAIKEDRAASEYVLIGTLASFGWAILTGYAMLGLLVRS